MDQDYSDEEIDGDISHVHDFFTEDDGESVLDGYDCTYCDEVGVPESDPIEAPGSPGSVVTTNTVISRGVLKLSLLDLCELVREHRSLKRAEIVQASSFTTRISLVIIHRFLLLKVRRDGKKDIWVRIDRQLGASLSGLIFGAGRTPANDTASVAVESALLLKSCKQENDLRFSLNPALGEFRRLLLAIHEELTWYSAWPENCWMFCSLLQEHLAIIGHGWFFSGKLQHVNLAVEIRDRVRSRILATVPHSRSPTPTPQQPNSISSINNRPTAFASAESRAHPITNTNNDSRINSANPQLLRKVESSQGPNEEVRGNSAANHPLPPQPKRPRQPDRPLAKTWAPAYEVATPTPVPNNQAFNIPDSEPQRSNSAPPQVHASVGDPLSSYSVESRPQGPYYGYEEQAKMATAFLVSRFICPSTVRRRTPSLSQGSLDTQDETLELSTVIAYAMFRSALPPSIAYSALFLLERLKKKFPRARGSSGLHLFMAAYCIATKAFWDDDGLKRSTKWWVEIFQDLFTVKEAIQMERELCGHLEWIIKIEYSELEDFITNTVKRLQTGDTPATSSSEDISAASPDELEELEATFATSL